MSIGVAYDGPVPEEGLSDQLVRSWRIARSGSFPSLSPTTTTSERRWCPHFAEARTREGTVYSLDDLGWNLFFEQQVTDDERARWRAARVVWEGRQRYRLSTGDAEWRAPLAGRIRHRAALRA